MESRTRVRQGLGFQGPAKGFERKETIREAYERPIRNGRRAAYAFFGVAAVNAVGWFLSFLPFFGRPERSDWLAGVQNAVLILAAAGICLGLFLTLRAFVARSKFIQLADEDGLTVPSIEFNKEFFSPFSK